MLDSESSGAFMGGSGNQRRTVSLLAEPGLDLRHESVDVRLVDDLRWYDDLVIRGDERLVALQVPGHVLHAEIAPLERLLHHGARDCARLDPDERALIVVEADHGHLADLAGLLEC